jgi:hypothetical protein
MMFDGAAAVPAHALDIGASTLQGGWVLESHTGSIESVLERSGLDWQALTTAR